MSAGLRCGWGATGLLRRWLARDGTAWGARAHSSCGQADEASFSGGEGDDDGRRRAERLREMEEAGMILSPSLPPEPRPTAPVNEESLTDLFSRRHTYLRISLTERCNLRCRYCMPAEGVPLTPSSGLMTASETSRLASLFVSMGVNKIRLTGGEPTLRRDLVEIVGGLSALEGVDQVGMTSNGIVLGRHLRDLRGAGLTHLNVSLDTLREERFERMTRRSGKGLRKVLAAVDDALGLGFQKVKLNVVVMKGENEDEVLDFVELARDRPLNVRFIEWMPFDGNVWSREKMEPYAETRARIEEAVGPMAPTTRGRGEVAKDFRPEGFAGEVSFVTSMTEHFCDSCNRIRLMADGNFKVCLFGNDEMDLLGPVRRGYSDGEIAHLIAGAVRGKKARHAGMFELSRAPNRHMVRIGG